MSNIYGRKDATNTLQLHSLGIASLLTGALLLSACGGGDSQVLGPKETTNSGNGGTNNNAGWVAGSFKPSSNFAHLCEVPRTGRSEFTGINFPDKKGTRTDEKNFLRAWTHETYLWFDEVVDRSPAVANQTPQDYFLQLKTNQLTSSGAPKDNFHFYEPTVDAEAWDAGITYDYGFRLKVKSTVPPREYYIAYVEPGSPAAAAGVARGDRILKIDSYSLVDGTSEAAIIALNEGLFPTHLGAAHNFELQPVTGEIKKVSLQSAQVEVSTVHHTSVIDTDSGKVGYLVFNSFQEKSQDEMVAAIKYLAQQQVTDLVLDLRYNGGGLLSVASQVAYMIAGSSTRDKTFYRQIQNSKQPVLPPFPFLDYGLYGLNRNLDLPSLNLSRVYVLSTGSTCSASEAVINGLRGVDVEVFLIGDTTCGKPYGFYPEDNCGTTYYTIQLQGANAKGFGEYSEGFSPATNDSGKDLVAGCRVSDDINHPLGDTNEAILAKALYYREHGTCGSAVTRSQQKTQGIPDAGELLMPEARKVLVLDVK